MNEFRSAAFTPPFTFTKSIEGPACDRAGNVYAVNYARRQTVGKVRPDGTSELWLELPEGSTGCGIRFSRSGDMFIADHTGHNLLRVDMESLQLTVYTHEPAMNQPNDLAVTKEGVLFASDPDWRNGTGQLWKIRHDGNACLLESGMGTTNGIEINPAETALYVNETLQRRIWAYDLSPACEISNKRLLAEFPDFALDGMRCDMAGNLYVTRTGKGCIAKVSPEGELLAEIPLIGRDCTNLTFGGQDGRSCYVTVADTGSIEIFRTDIPGRCWGLWQ